MIIYISGPMTGLPNLNREAFQLAHEYLREAGHEVLNPATIPESPDKQWADYMRDALAMMLKAEAVALLSGWRKSRGAIVEWKLAKDLDMPIRLVRNWARP